MTLPADPREPREIATDLATRPGTPAGDLDPDLDPDLDEVLRITDALRAHPADVGLLGRARDQYVPHGPVTSGTFA